jgi:2-(1,2-epoxy-1,2-dihydrophenyl)acetyl-CoA isomerase
MLTVKGANVMAVTELLDRNLLTITLDRPEALNALTQSMMRKLVKILSAAAIDPDVHAVLLRGAGRAFCTGGDRKRSREPDPEDALAGLWREHPAWGEPEMRFDRLRANVRASELLRGMPKPTIAAVRGPAIGAGLSLAAACDFRIVSDTAVFRAGFALAGYSGDYGANFLLVRLIGPARAREMMMLDEIVSAEEAKRIGLVTRVVADDALDVEAEIFARRFVGGPRLAYRYIKRGLAAAETQSFATALDGECEAMIRSSLSVDAAEARAAFAEKRDPKFQGR